MRKIQVAAIIEATMIRDEEGRKRDAAIAEAHRVKE